jgi:hypothetical protein
MRRQNVERITPMMMQKTLIEMQTQMSVRKMPTSSIEEQLSRYQVSLLDN